MARKATNRETRAYTFTIQATDVRHERLATLMNMMYEVIRLAGYPNEFINPDKGDYVKFDTKEVRRG